MMCPNCGEISKRDVWILVKVVWDYGRSEEKKREEEVYCVKCGARLV